jgi:beta-N-acetylhexosaminidase
MMVGHLFFDALDERAPASMSRAIVFGLLRQKLGYRGLVVIDDVDDPALIAGHSRAMIARLGVASGADCFLCARHPETAFDLIRAIDQGVRAGEILPERIESARRRIAPLLHRYVRGVGSTLDQSAGAYLVQKGQDQSGLTLSAASLDPGVDAASHVGPRSLATDKKQHQH